MVRQIYWSVHLGRQLLADGFVGADDDKQAMEKVCQLSEVKAVLRPGGWYKVHAGAMLACVDGPTDASRIAECMGWGQNSEKLEARTRSEKQDGFLFSEPKKQSYVYDLGPALTGDILRKLLVPMLPPDYDPAIDGIVVDGSRHAYRIQVHSRMQKYAGHVAELIVSEAAIFDQLAGLVPWRRSP